LNGAPVNNACAGHANEIEFLAIMLMFQHQGANGAAVAAAANDADALLLVQAGEISGQVVLAKPFHTSLSTSSALWIKTGWDLSGRVPASNPTTKSTNTFLQDAPGFVLNGSETRCSLLHSLFHGGAEWPGVHCWEGLPGLFQTRRVLVDSPTLLTSIQAKRMRCSSRPI
jgi:hypothetical protein